MTHPYEFKVANNAWNYRVWYGRTSSIRGIMWREVSVVLAKKARGCNFDTLHPVRAMLLRQGSLQDYLRPRGQTS